MTEIISNIKPKVEPRPEVKIEYNDRSYQSFIKNGFPDVPRSVAAPRQRIIEFLVAVDPRKGPVERTVVLMVRLKVNSRLEYQEKREKGVSLL